MPKPVLRLREFYPLSILFLHEKPGNLKRLRTMGHHWLASQSHRRLRAYARMEQNEKNKTQTENHINVIEKNIQQTNEIIRFRKKVKAIILV